MTTIDEKLDRVLTIDGKLDRVLAELAEIRANLARPIKPPVAAAPSEQERFVTIPYFMKMLGMHRGWYYRHVRAPGMPQRVQVGGKPMLSHQACKAYVERLKGTVDPAPAKRGPGRPRKFA